MEHSYRVYLHNVPCWLFIFKWNSMEAPSKHPHHGNTIIIYPPTHTYRFYCHPPNSLTLSTIHPLLHYAILQAVEHDSGSECHESRGGPFTSDTHSDNDYNGNTSLITWYRASSAVEVAARVTECKGRQLITSPSNGPYRLMVFSQNPTHFDARLFLLIPTHSMV